MASGEILSVNLQPMLSLIMLGLTHVQALWNANEPMNTYSRRQGQDI